MSLPLQDPAIITITIDIPYLSQLIGWWRLARQSITFCALSHLSNPTSSTYFFVILHPNMSMQLDSIRAAYAVLHGRVKTALRRQLGDIQRLSIIRGDALSLAASAEQVSHCRLELQSHN